MAVQYRMDPPLEPFGRTRRGKAEIEKDFHLPWNDVGRPGSTVNVRDLPGRGGKVFVAPVPFGCRALGGYERVARPLLERAGGHDVRVADEAQQGTGVSASGPEIGHLAAPDRLERKSDPRKTSG